MGYSKTRARDFNMSFIKEKVRDISAPFTYDLNQISLDEVFVTQLFAQNQWKWEALQLWFWNNSVHPWLSIIALKPWLWFRSFLIGIGPSTVPFQEICVSSFKFSAYEEIQ